MIHHKFSYNACVLSEKTVQQMHKSLTNDVCDVMSWKPIEEFIQTKIDEMTPICYICYRYQGHGFIAISLIECKTNKLLDVGDIYISWKTRKTGSTSAYPEKNFYDWHVRLLVKWSIHSMDTWARPENINWYMRVGVWS